MHSATLLSFTISCICLAMLTLADQESTSAPDNYKLDWPRKANIIDCRAAFLSIGDCYRETIREFRTRQVRIFLGPVCCKAVRELNFGCWPRMLGVNPFIPPFLLSYCSAFHDGPLTMPFGTARVAEPRGTTKQPEVKATGF
ncbi:putative Prolamin-like domain-containing protein [Helianthus annuus]|nr:putative Prolamin-like domain-containing protein [Helianthus annuus]